MKKLSSLLIFMFMFQMAISQNHEIGIYVGGTNMMSDVGRTTYIKPRHLALGVIYKWNVNRRYAWRFAILHSKIGANDDDAVIESRQERHLRFENDITEASAAFEFNFFDFDLEKRPFLGTPYVSVGLGYFRMDNLSVINRKYNKDGKTGDFAIPMVIGYKMKIAEKFILALETGPRYTFSDNIDGSNPKNSSLQFGNTNSKDWYVFTGVTLTYIFGKKPCNCVEDN
jgi:Domain of unknown function (DUF6089)